MDFYIDAVIYIFMFILQVFRIHPLTTEDILMEEGREKCEMFMNYYFVCFRTFVLDPNSHNFLNPMSIYTLVFPGGIISVSLFYDVVGTFHEIE